MAIMVDFEALKSLVAAAQEVAAGFVAEVEQELALREAAAAVLELKDQFRATQQQVALAAERVPGKEARAEEVVGTIDNLLGQFMASVPEQVAAMVAQLETERAQAEIARRQAEREARRREVEQANERARLIAGKAYELPATRKGVQQLEALRAELAALRCDPAVREEAACWIKERAREFWLAGLYDKKAGAPKKDAPVTVGDIVAAKGGKK